MTVQNEIDRASQLGQKLEDLVVRKGQLACTGDRETLLIAYWALIFDYHKGILALLSNGFCGSAFALVRPVVEALVRSHLVLMCSQEDLRKIQQDEYRVNFETVGAQIDAAFGLEGLLDNLLRGSRTALHSFTHSGVSQLARRFEGNDLKPRYTDGEITEVIGSTTSAVFMVTCLVTKHFKFEDEWKAAQEVFTQYGTP